MNHPPAFTETVKARRLPRPAAPPTSIRRTRPHKTRRRTRQSQTAPVLRVFYGAGLGCLVAVLLCGYYLLDHFGNPFDGAAFSGTQRHWFLYFLGSAILFGVFGLFGWFYQRHALNALRAVHQNLTRAHSDAQQARLQARHILESLTDGSFSVDAAGRFTDIDTKAEYMLNVSKSDVVGRDAWAYFDGKVNDMVRHRVRKAIKESVPQAFEAFYALQNRWFMVHLFPSAETCMFFVRDITGTKNRENNLLAAREKAEHLAHLKSTLMANLSHEIRTPLTSVIGFASILSHEAKGEHQEFACLIEKNGHRLMETLNAVLEQTEFER